MDLEQRLSSIESRLSALEKQKMQKAPSGPACKKCGSSDREFLTTRKDPHFGVFGATIDEYKCMNCDLIVEVHNKGAE